MSAWKKMDACTVGFFESTGKSVNIGLSMLGNLIRQQGQQNE